MFVSIQNRGGMIVGEDHGWVVCDMMLHVGTAENVQQSAKINLSQYYSMGKILAENHGYYGPHHKNKTFRAWDVSAGKVLV